MCDDIEAVIERLGVRQLFIVGIDTLESMRDLGRGHVRGQRRARAEGHLGATATVRGPGAGLMEPRIQYAKTSDGVIIAYATVGEGPPLVRVVHSLNSTVQLEWKEATWGWWDVTTQVQGPGPGRAARRRGFALSRRSQGVCQRGTQ